MYNLTTTEYHGIRVLTSAQVAEMYGTDTKTISYNFSYNKKKYTEGKHYIKLEGNELREFNCLYKEVDEIYHEIALKMGISDSGFIIL